MKGRTNKVTMRTAIFSTIMEMMKKDSSVFILGEGSRIKLSFDYPEILFRFPDRVLTTPVCEGGIVGLALGSALEGMRPIVDLTFNDLSLRAMDEILNHVAKVHFITGGKLSARMVIKADFNRPENAQSGDRQEALFLHTPGLKVVIPSTPSDAAFLMRLALTSNDPILFFEDRIVNLREELPRPNHPSLGFGKARVVRTGNDVSVISYGVTVHFALKAAKELDMYSVEVIDLRTLNPLDFERIMLSVEKTGRALIVEPDHRRMGVGAEIAAQLSEKCFEKLRAPVRRIAMEDLLLPAAKQLQPSLLPSVSKIKKGIVDVVGE